MNTLEEFKELVAKYQASKSVETALALGRALLEIRRRHMDATQGDIDSADAREERFLRWFNISDATVRRLKLLAIWEQEVLVENPETLTKAYGIVESLNSAALRKDNNSINRGGRPRKNETAKALELLRLAVQHWLASGRPASQFMEHVKFEIGA